MTRPQPICPLAPADKTYGSVSGSLTLRPFSTNRRGHEAFSEHLSRQLQAFETAPMDQKCSAGSLLPSSTTGRAKQHHFPASSSRVEPFRLCTRLRAIGSFAWGARGRAITITCVVGGAYHHRHIARTGTFCAYCAYRLPPRTTSRSKTSSRSIRISATVPCSSPARATAECTCRS